MSQDRLNITWVKSRTDRKFGNVLDIALYMHPIVYTIVADEKNKRISDCWSGWYAQLTDEEGPLLEGEYLRLFKGPFAELWSMHKVLMTEHYWTGAGEAPGRVKRESNIHEVLSSEEREIHREYMVKMLELRRKQVKNLEILLENT